MLDFARSLTLRSIGRYVRWRAGGKSEPVALEARSGIQFELRPDGIGARGNDDYGVAYDVFVHDLYKPPAGLDAAKVALVVDLGANVGFSVLQWLHRFPNCQVIAFEPHPDHASQARRNISSNGMGSRVELHEAGAGRAPGRTFLSDVGSSSTVLTDGEGIEIDVVDVFPLLMSKRIDILKMDIEGAEYEIMSDPRFADLNIQALVMEWHARDGAGRDWCVARLEEVGFDVTETQSGTMSGMLWALRRPGP